VSNLSFMSKVVYRAVPITVERAVVRGPTRISVLGPLLYVMYTAEHGRVVELHGLKLHQYADDSQVYMSIIVGTATPHQPFRHSLRVLPI